MQTREIIPLKQGLDFNLILPGSKSITNRAFLCAALARGKSRLFGMLESDDTTVMLEALKKLGVRFGNFSDRIEILGCGGKFKSGDFTFDLHNAGTATRFLTALMAIREGKTIITGDKRMQERPIGDLVDGLKQIGAEIEYLGKDGCPPIKIKDKIKIKIKDKELRVRMKGDRSSQYFSAILMIAPLLNQSLTIEVVGELVSKSYIDTTLAVMRAFGVKVRNNDYKSFKIKPQAYKAIDYYIEGDASAASYWTSIAYLHKGKVKFSNLESKSIQGDNRYGDVLKLVDRQSEINMNDMPDSAMTLALTAGVLGERVKITGLSTLRIKETDRLAALENELKKIGVKVRTTKDSIVLQGLRTKSEASSDSELTSEDYRLNKEVNIHTYNDHRMAMCFAVVGTVIPGIVIEDSDCVDKTYPEFWKDLERMYLSKKINLGHKNLVLTGMRCSGKTYLGKKIAKMLGRKFVDLDALIEKKEGMMIKKIVQQKGWYYFRLIEQEICSEFGAEKDLIIATGGGVILDESNMKNLKKNGINVFVFADPSVLAERLAGESENRPSLTSKKAHDEIMDVWLARRDLYLKYADHVWDNTSGKVINELLPDVFSGTISNK